MSWDFDRTEVVEAVRTGRVDLLWGVIEHAYKERDEARGKLTFAALRSANSRRCEAAYHPVGAWSMTDWLTAVAGEVGELVKELEPYPSAYYLGLTVSKSTGYLANAIKNMRRKETEGWSAHRIKEHSKQAIADEAADVAIYLDLLCYRFGIDLGEAVRRKFNEVSDRTGTDIKL